MHPTAQRRLTRVRGWLVPLALALLLFAQSLAMLHGVVHGPGKVAKDIAVATADAAPAAGTFDALFGEHSDTECRLYDQLARADLATVPVLALTFPLQAPVLAGAEPTVPQTARLRAYRARDPPLLG